ncbi:SNX29 protein, partial [Polyodon spathula]|nr:SNX29 protein [Polyodon spathula]
MSLLDAVRSLKHASNAVSQQTMQRCCKKAGVSVVVEESADKYNHNGNSDNTRGDVGVYIRILDNEWNVYRRYTDFRTLHHRLRSRFPQVNTFNFPPKKAIGNKFCCFIAMAITTLPNFKEIPAMGFRVRRRSSLKELQYLHVQQQVLNSGLHHVCVSEEEVSKHVKSSARSWACEVDLLETIRCNNDSARDVRMDAKFVEGRRKQLQSYLRSVMNKVVQTLPEFTASPTKENLLQLLPFCMDTPPLTDSGNKPSRSRVASRFPKLSRSQQKETRNLEPQSGDL